MAKWITKHHVRIPIMHNHIRWLVDGCICVTGPERCTLTPVGSITLTSDDQGAVSRAFVRATVDDPDYEVDSALVLVRSHPVMDTKNSMMDLHILNDPWDEVIMPIGAVLRDDASTEFTLVRDPLIGDQTWHRVYLETSGGHLFNMSTSEVDVHVRPQEIWVDGHEKPIPVKTMSNGGHYALHHGGYTTDLFVQHVEDLDFLRKNLEKMNDIIFCLRDHGYDMLVQNDAYLLQKMWYHANNAISK